MSASLEAMAAELAEVKALLLVLIAERRQTAADERVRTDVAAAAAMGVDLLTYLKNKTKEYDNAHRPQKITTHKTGCSGRPPFVDGNHRLSRRPRRRKPDHPGS